MDNVLIDDRRIHVDFSQSVSKLQAEWRRAQQHSSVKPVVSHPNTASLSPRSFHFSQAAASSAWAVAWS